MEGEWNSLPTEGRCTLWDLKQNTGFRVSSNTGATILFVNVSYIVSKLSWCGRTLLIACCVATMLWQDPLDSGWALQLQHTLSGGSSHSTIATSPTPISMPPRTVQSVSDTFRPIFSMLHDIQSKCSNVLPNLYQKLWAMHNCSRHYSGNKIS